MPVGKINRQICLDEDFEAYDALENALGTASKSLFCDFQPKKQKNTLAVCEIFVLLHPVKWAVIRKWSI